MRKCVETFEAIKPKGKFPLTKVASPFAKDTPGPQLRPYEDGPWMQCPFCKGRYSPHDFTHGHTKDPPSKADPGSPMPRDVDPTPDHIKNPGALAPIASKMLMMVLYGARSARPDLQRTIGNLARYITRWSKAHDEELRVLMSWINCSYDYRHFGYISQDATLDSLHPHIFADAAFADDL